jgi:hypothetical protein
MSLKLKSTTIDIILTPMHTQNFQISNQKSTLYYSLKQQALQSPDAKNLISAINKEFDTLWNEYVLFKLVGYCWI